MLYSRFAIDNVVITSAAQRSSGGYRTSETLTVTSTIWVNQDAPLRAFLIVESPRRTDTSGSIPGQTQIIELQPTSTDIFSGSFIPDYPGRWTLKIEVRATYSTNEIAGKSGLTALWIHPALESAAKISNHDSYLENDCARKYLDFFFTQDHPWVADYPHWFSPSPLDHTHADHPQLQLAVDTYKQEVYPFLLKYLASLLKQGVRNFYFTSVFNFPIDMWQWLINESRIRATDVCFYLEKPTRLAHQHSATTVGFLFIDHPLPVHSQIKWQQP